jgi:CubicO group peptidase (beta-lactamase class C family)
MPPGPRPIEPEAAGFDPAKLARVVARFRRQQERGRFPGGQIAVCRDGRLALDEAIGTARGFRPDEQEPATPYTRRTLGSIFSASKGLVATAIALLEAQGKLDVEAPIAEIFPEFGRGGKERITTLDVLTQRAGLMMRALTRRLTGEALDAAGSFVDRETVVDALEAERPAYERGTLAYQAFGFGWALAEVAERAAGRSLEELLTDSIFAPAGLDIRLRATAAELPSLARTYWLGGGKLRLDGENLAAGFERFHNGARYLTAHVPGALAVTTAADLAAFYEILAREGETPDGRRLLPASIVRRYATRTARGFERSLGVPVVLGRGFSLGWLPPHPYGRWNTGACFGHPGAFCVVAFADPRHRMGVAIVTNGNRGPMDLAPRFGPLASEIRAALAS